MPKYPNDPGSDNQQPIPYRPDEMFTFIDQDTFSEALALQTKYSYECSKMFHERSISALMDAKTKIDCQFDTVDEKLNSIVRVTDDAIMELRSMIGNIRHQIGDIMDHVHDLEEHDRNRLTADDRQMMLRMIYCS